MKWLRRSLSFEKSAIYVLLIFFALLFLLPTFIAINTAFKPPTEVWEVTSFSSRFYLGNFKEGLSKIGRGLINSALIAFPAMLISTFVGSLAAYPLSQLKFKGDTAVYFLLLAGMYVPCQTVLIPLFFIIRRLGLYDTIPGLWLVHTAYGIPFTTLILRNFFAIVPGELMEAAALDGCGIMGYYWKILLPVGRSGIATTLILQFRAIWNEFLFALTLTQSTKTIPVTVCLQSFVSTTEVQWGPLTAAALITILPTIVVFLVFKKHFVKGLAGVYK